MQEDTGTNARRPTLRELEVLRTLITYGKATAAARKLGISQPAVSRAIHQLEQRTELTLFRREGGRLLPTAEALALYQESEPIFLTFERLERVRWRPEEANPILRIAAPPTLAHWFLHGLLAKFSQREPETRIQIEIGSGLDVVTMVANGNMDLGLVDSAQNHMGVRFVAFRSSDAHATIPAESPLAKLKEITPHDLDGIPFIALVRRIALGGMAAAELEVQLPIPAPRLVMWPCLALLPFMGAYYLFPPRAFSELAAGRGFAFGVLGSLVGAFAAWRLLKDDWR